MEKFIQELDAWCDCLTQDMIDHYLSIEERLLKYNECQPRVPAGNPDGGQWAAPPRGVPLCGGGIGINEPLIEEGHNDFDDYDNYVQLDEPIAGNDEVFFVNRQADQYGNVPDQVNIFVGGFIDDLDHRNMQNSNTLNRDSLGDNYYTAHDSNDRNKISEVGNRVPSSKVINEIGHSYGGDSAADLALARPGMVNILITLDPVSISQPDPQKIKDSVNFWINVNATGSPMGSTMGDNTAMVGGDWGNGPEGFADIHLNVPVSHEDVNGMMNARLPDGRTIQEFLNGVQPMDKLIDDILREGNQEFHLESID